MLTQSGVADYLLSLGLVKPAAVVEDDLVVVDASKGPAFGLALAGAPGIDLRMLNVVRDPRAVAWSWKREVERPHAARPECRREHARADQP